MRRFIALTTIALLALTACSSGSDSGTSAADGKPTVVTSTSVWASVARAVAGDHASVTTIIDSPQQDPHDYEASAQDKLAFADATVTVVNGGGYDDWATTIASKQTTLINAVESSGLPNAGQESFNEHVWYSPDAVQKVATSVSEALAKADPDHAGDYAANAKTFTAEVGKLGERAKAMGAATKKSQADGGVVATEPVADHLFTYAGLTNLTPESFIEQSESDAGPSVAVIDETATVITSGKVRGLAINPQTSDPVSDKLISAAKKASVPTFEVHEVLPDPEQTYVSFLGQTLDSLDKALNQ